VLVKRPRKGRELIDQPEPDFATEGLELANYLANTDTRICNLLNLERETRLELATPTLASSGIDGHKTLKYQCFACS
jgi:hypothetical protein